ncbi:UNVERIFIED_ORG: hypothetical protein J2740_002455 [Rhizobium nepotum]|nr:hypothetical protein [Rhizobium nepotum]
MRSHVRERLLGLGCKSIPVECTPRSFGAGFLRIKRFARYRASREAHEALRVESESEGREKAAHNVTSPGR